MGAILPKIPVCDVLEIDLVQDLEIDCSLTIVAIVGPAEPAPAGTKSQRLRLRAPSTAQRPAAQRSTVTYTIGPPHKLVTSTNARSVAKVDARTLPRLAPSLADLRPTQSHGEPLSRRTANERATYAAS